MPLAAGARCGPYEIISLLGTGGMGEVYRARDLRLGRDIAIKLLPDNPDIDREHLDRFEQEARSASALNHPNIVTIYELGHVDSTHYIAMELIEGRTLRALLTSGSMPVAKAIQIATQIADGLAKAHEVGIVHRDLKPENLMVSPDGFVKILDFGLAKLAHAGGEFIDGGTIDFQTRAGTVLGTVEYMSPEQAIGGSIDFRSDQFSFGLVLYEMVTGKRAYQRSTKPATLVAIVREEPEPIGSLSHDLPIPLHWVIERCLERDPEKRYVSTRDLARDLASMRDHLSSLQQKPLKTRPSNLPPQRTGLLGRDLEVDSAKELLRRPNMRLVTITGPAGIGKTRLALQLAGEMTPDFPGGVYFVPLAAVSDASLIASVIVQTLGIPETGSQSPLEMLKEFLQNSLRAPMLIVFDNFEHLVSAAPMLAELLAIGGSDLKFLVTSRASLHVYGEQEFPVPPLALPDSRSLPSLEGLLQYSAIALFVQRASAVKPDFELTEQNAAAVAEICARLDGLPLAIELAAARIKLLSPSAMQTRLASRLQLLTGGARDLPTRQQTLRGAIDWSYDLLNAAEQKLFSRLSVFKGGAPLDAVEAVCNTKNDLGIDLLDGMASMVDKSLVQQVEQPTGDLRFVMLETIREYALDKLTASGEVEPTKRAHAAYYLVLAEEGASEEAGAESSEWLNSLETEHSNILSALDWLTDTGNADWALRFGTALFRFWETREYLTEGRDRLGKILKLEGAVALSEARERALFAAGVLAGGQGDYTSADTLLEEGLQLARKLSDERGVAVCLNAQAVLARDRNDITLSRRLFEESLALWRESGDPLAIARSLSNLASVARLQSDFARARSFYAECLSIFRKSNNQTGIAWSLNYQGDVARDQGDVESARALYEESLDTFRELGDRWGMAGSLADLGNLTRDQGNYDVAESLYRESMKMFQALGHKRGIARVLECFACSAAARRLPARSLRLAGAAAALRQTFGAPLTPSEQAKLEKGLGPARQMLTDSTGTTVWYEGWTVPVEKAIEEVLMPQSAARSATASRSPEDPAA
jgi:predicted ATPase